MSVILIDETRYTLRGLRGNRTRQRNAVNAQLGLLGQPTPENVEHPIPELSPSERLTVVERLLAQISEYDRAILNHSELPEEDFETEQTNIEQFEAPVRVEIARQIRQIDGTGTAVPESVRDDPSITRQVMFGNISSRSQPIHERNVPESRAVYGTSQLDLAPEKFDGDRLKYRQFKAQFECWIQRQASTTPRERLMILRKYLASDPKDLIDPLELTDANYNIAWSLLDSNFSRVDTERERVLAELRDLRPRMSHPNDSANLRKLLNTVQRNTRILETLGYPLSSIAPLLKSSIEAALPSKVRQDYKNEQRLEARFATLSLPSSGVAVDPAGEQVEATDSLRVDGLAPGMTTAESTRTDDCLVREVESLLEFLRQRVNDLEDVKLLDGAVNPGSAAQGAKPKNSSNPKKPPPYTVAGASEQTDQLRTGKGAPRQKKKFPPRSCLFCSSTEHGASRCSADLSHEQKKEILVRQKRCPKCLRPEHNRPSECQGTRYPCDKCNSHDHYPVMHANNSCTTGSTVLEQVTAGVTSMENALLMTVSAFIVNGGVKIPVRILLDSGSSLTFISPSTRRLLRGAEPVQRADFRIQGFASLHEITAERFNIRLADAGGSKVIELLAYEYRFGVNPPNHVPAKVMEALRQFNRERGLSDLALLDGQPTPPPAILVGIDQLYKIKIPKAPLTVIDSLLAFETVFGWTVAGPTSWPEHEMERSALPVAHTVCCAATLSRPAQALEALWQLDAIPGDGADSTLTADQESAVKQFRESIRFEDNHYVVSFPKKPSIVNLLNNKTAALDRLRKKISQLIRNPDKYARYDDEILSFVRDGHAAEVAEVSLTSPSCSDGSFYMPHHQVVTGEGETEKWRIVFDCSAKVKGATSLNDHLLPGPNLNQELVKLLINFRLHSTAVSADITKAYMRIAIDSADRPYFRFLWKSPSEDRIRCYSMTKVTWGAASSSFILAATIREHFKRVIPDAEEEFSACVYADDFVKSCPSNEQAITFTNRLRDVLRQAGMELAKWKTNSRPLASHLAATGADTTTQQARDSRIFKVLGILWSSSTDDLRFDLSTVAERAVSRANFTKRFVLSLVASIYDPLSLLSPFTLRGKRLIQKLWSEDLQWDQLVSSEVHSEVSQWAAETDVLKHIRISRHYTGRGDPPIAYKLHLFSDASPAAYASVAYIEYCYADGTSKFSLVMSKSKLAPRDQQSLPRLELMAALTSVKLKRFLTQRFEITFSTVSYYTDSLITYHWVTSGETGKWRTFIANRLNEIQAESDVQEWFFVPGDLNIADLATRGIAAQALVAASSWWTGPDWLREPPERRPTSRPKLEDKILGLVRTEIRATVATISQTLPLIDITRFSSYGRALRVLALVVKFTEIARRRQPPAFAELVRQSEIRLIMWTQQQYFKRELECVTAGDRVPRASKLSSFTLFIEDGILRAKTRLTKSPIFTYDEMNPVIIPGESRLATLLILDAHRVNAHFGVSTVLTQLRRRFWITRGRQLIRALLSKCVICKMRQGQPAQQIEAPLPPERTIMLAPFAVTGLDFCGPFYARPAQAAKTKNSKDERDSMKLYVALFVCTSTRAVHFEVVPAMTTAQTHLALRRFLSICPTCTKIYSDNAKSFIRAATDIKAVFNSFKHKDVRDLLASRRIEWSFICPRAPWHGGSYERLVGTFKRAMAKTLGRSFISFEEFRTIVTELASVINDRPITHTSSDIDAPAALTPAQFLRGGPSPSPLVSIRPLDNLGPNGKCSGDDLRANQKLRTSYFQSLSTRWYREYILMLRSANSTRGQLTRPIGIGDVCLVKDENTPRLRWKLVRVLEAHAGRDGNVRTYTVRFENRSTSRRAAQSLYPLEIADECIPSDLIAN